MDPVKTAPPPYDNGQQFHPPASAPVPVTAQPEHYPAQSTPTIVEPINAPKPCPVTADHVYAPQPAAAMAQPVYDPQPAAVMAQPVYDPQPEAAMAQPVYDPQPTPVIAQPVYNPQPAPDIPQPAYFPPRAAPVTAQAIYFAPHSSPGRTISTMSLMSGGIMTTNINAMGANPQITICSSCNQQISTQVQYKVTMRTHFVAAMLCMTGCWPCMLIPYCTNTCKNLDHYCPNCQAYLGSYLEN